MAEVWQLPWPVSHFYYSINNSTPTERCWMPTVCQPQCRGRTMAPISVHSTPPTYAINSVLHLLAFLWKDCGFDLSNWLLLMSEMCGNNTFCEWSDGFACRGSLFYNDKWSSLWVTLLHHPFCYKAVTKTGFRTDASRWLDLCVDVS